MTLKKQRLLNKTPDPRATKRFYVYVLIDEQTQRTFYVGKGTGNRVGMHEIEAAGGCCCRKCLRIREIWDCGGCVVKRIVFETDNEAEAYAHEVKKIASLGRARLVNGNAGGAGGLHPIMPWDGKTPLQMTEEEYELYLLSQPGFNLDDLDTYLHSWRERKYEQARHELSVAQRARYTEAAARWQQEADRLRRVLDGS